MRQSAVCVRGPSYYIPERGSLIGCVYEIIITVRPPRQLLLPLLHCVSSKSCDALPLAAIFTRSAFSQAGMEFLFAMHLFEHTRRIQLKLNLVEFSRHKKEK